MTRFGEWLGKSNGETMPAEILGNCDCSKEQARCAIVTYCMLFGVEVDTKEWDELIREMFDDYNSWFDNYDEFDNYMSELLV